MGLSAVTRTNLQASGFTPEEFTEPLYRDSIGSLAEILRSS